MAAAPRSCTAPPQSHAVSWRATSTPNRSQRASSLDPSRSPTCPTWTCCGGPAPSSARPTSSPGTPRTPNCSSPPASGQTSTAATYGTPSPNTHYVCAATARPPADLNANLGHAGTAAGIRPEPHPCRPAPPLVPRGYGDQAEEPQPALHLRRGRGAGLVGRRHRQDPEAVPG